MCRVRRKDFHRTWGYRGNDAQLFPLFRSPSLSFSVSFTFPARPLTSPLRWWRGTAPSPCCFTALIQIFPALGLGSVRGTAGPNERSESLWDVRRTEGREGSCRPLCLPLSFTTGRLPEATGRRPRAVTRTLPNGAAATATVTRVSITDGV